METADDRIGVQLGPGAGPREVDSYMLMGMNGSSKSKGGPGIATEGRLS